MLLFLIVHAHDSWGWYEERELIREVEELRKTGEPLWPGDFKRKPIARELNGALLLRAAAGAIDENRDEWRRLQQMEPQLPLNEQELGAARGVLEANGQALRLLREARGKKEINWEVNFATPMIQVRLPDLTPLGRLRQAADVRAMVALHNGEDARAMEAIDDLLMISRAAEEMNVLVGHLVALSAQAMAVMRATELAQQLKLSDDLPAEAVRELIKGLLDETALCDGWQRGVLMERAAMIDSALYTAKSKVQPPRGTKHPPIGTPLRPLILRDARYMLWHGTQMAAAAELADWPAYRKATRAASEDLDGAYLLRPLHIMSSILMPAFDSMAKRHYSALADRRMGAAALAIRLYVIEHGAMPKTLDELVPKYLPAAPIDPLTEGKRIGYDSNRQILWSVGTNEKDDGGSEKLLPRATPGQRFQMEDLVVHLKRQAREKR